MVWASWVNRINTLPELLAGPILRHVDANSVTVWIALRSASTCTLRVFSATNSLQMIGTRRTVRLAEHLHVAAITAAPFGPLVGLVPNQIYSYDVYVRAGLVDGEVPTSAPSLRSPELLQGSAGIGPSTLGYGAFLLPTFALPPVNLEQVRLIHGSCRKPHAEGRDALRVLGSLIAESATDPNRRPHQLFLTGDQIYADDVADALLFMLMDVGQALGFANEAIANGPPPLPSRRAEFVRRAGITSDAKVAVSHLITFAEYCAMYLFAWSRVFWPTDFPLYTQATGRPISSTTEIDLSMLFSQQVDKLRGFRDTVEEVRRSLANIPTYMIFDDHEVTDDWFLDNQWVNNSVNDPLMRRIVHNGVSAYAIFQGWGNTPTQFGPSTAGGALLGLLETYAQAPTEANASPVRERLGLPMSNFTSERYPRSPLAVGWHYVVVAPAYQVLVLDARTRRGYPGGAPHNHPALMTEETFNEQLVSLQPLTADQLLLVVAPAPPVGFTPLEGLQMLGSDAPWVYENDVEFWQSQVLTFERLLMRLTARPSPVGGVRKLRMAFLSGDVHYGFAARLRYRATTPLGGPADTREAVVAQFTSSACKNEDRKTRFLHSGGYNALVIIRPPQTMVRYGWNNAGGGSIKVGAEVDEDSILPMNIWLSGSPIVFELPALFIPADAAVPPDWRTRIKFIPSDDDRSQVATPPPKNVPVPPAGNKQLQLQARLDTLNNHNSYRALYSTGKELVGKNNLGELTFQWGSAENQKVATQQLWWWLAAQPQPFQLSRFRCPLDLNVETF